MANDPLKLEQVPAAFAVIAEKHNALVDLIRSISGSNGIDVTITNKNIIIQLPFFRETSLSVCVNGSPSTKTFLTKD